ncbi:MAG: 30S ribosomal protein S8 [Patescibacteria group bacterium]
MVNDHLSDLIARVKNGYHAQREEIVVNATKTVESVLSVLAKNKYIETATREGKEIKVKLRYEGGKPAVMGIQRMSKPGARYYLSVSELPRVWGGLGINIVSTSKGIMDGKQAKKIKQGGELIAQVW